MEHYDRLVNSLKRLYSNPEFSDLSIVSTHKTYPVHKAVVCLRSPYLAERCRDPSLAGFPTVVEVKDDDPQAVHLAMEYFYHLDYSDTLPEALRAAQPSNPPCESSGPAQDDFTPESPLIVTSGFKHPEDQAQPAQEESIADSSTTEANHSGVPPSPSEPLDDFLPPAPKKKKGKKKTGRASIKLPPSPPADPQPDAPATGETPCQEPTTTPEPSPLAASSGPTETHPHNEDGQLLTTHAKLYSLSAKYGIPELRALALAKFERQAETGWDAADFIRAAAGVYASPLLGDESHRAMRRAVTGLMYGHRELLDCVGVEEVLRGELGLDLIRRMREEGVW
ncbi:hypothetical protein B0H67DRAFT_150778 [Lasiosphaeris hirsuta]|uniref:BTB domain-containing protein n=1 Tax=Lasiosphaeris hirsuta TaxID=260670 RepID=A0AA40E043_9PEZI|nr:hypothetical protein B0H67DRAFT_150778 [Lasiosphaeris hirsuta]